jgi:hypothetical protein
MLRILDAQMSVILVLWEKVEREYSLELLSRLTVSNLVCLIECWYFVSSY